MPYVNIGILAHVDAGKTSLTERLLFHTGVIATLGRVDDGTTRTDSLALEQQRGITIKSAVASFVTEGVTVNLIDTPGHPDFIAEVERVLDVLDGVILVVSAVEGVQHQTRVLMRTLQRLRIPTLFFVNKIDRPGADGARVARETAEKLAPASIVLGAISAQGTRQAAVTSLGATDPDFRARLLEVLAEHDEALLALYVHGETNVPYPWLRDELAMRIRQAMIYPVLFGSAITGAGVEDLLAGIREFFPLTDGKTDGPVRGTVFKIERGPTGEKIAYVRLFSGTIRVRDRVPFGRDQIGRVTAIRVFDRAQALRSDAVTAGRIGKLWGLGAIRIGDRIGDQQGSEEHRYFAPPTLETVVVPERSADRGALHASLVQLAEQDPLINLHTDDERQEFHVSLYGEVQKEVIQETLASEFGLAVAFRETTVLCVERPIGSGEAVDSLGDPLNPFCATVGLRVEPAPLGTGVRLQLAVKLETIPLFIYRSAEVFQRAMEETARETLLQGLYGWPVTDCLITMTASGYISPVSGARDFRLLTPLVLMQALQEAGTTVHEPLHRFHLEVPAESLPLLLPALARLRANPGPPVYRGTACTLEGEIPAARLHDLQQQLSGLTHGEGVLDYAFDHYEPVRGTIPTRPRTDRNPLNRKDYLLRLAGRV